MNLRRLSTLLAGLLATIAVAGCATTGTDTGHQKPGGALTGHEVADADNDGTYVSAGPITYQLQISRLMNPWGQEDSQYFMGLPKGVHPYLLPPDELWYGVFLWAKNQHHGTYATAAPSDFEITDTMGNVYRPTPLDPSVNPFAWDSENLQYGETEPGQDTTAANGFTGGKLLLFKVNDSIYDNRPLTLYILSSSGQRIGEISLDLSRARAVSAARPRSRP